MITDALLRVVAWVVETVTGWLPDFETPEWLTSVGDRLAGLVDAVEPLGVWVPLDFSFTVATTLLVCLGIGLLLKVARIVASFLTVGGGSAG